MSLSPVGDTIALGNLAFQLYSKGFAVARDAPEEFQQLLGELNVFKRTLWQIRHSTVGKKAKLLDATAEEAVKLCFGSLYSFETILSKYESLASTSRGCWRRRIQWAYEQNSIESCRRKIKDCSYWLTFALIPEQRARLSPGYPSLLIANDDPDSSGINQDRLSSISTIGTGSGPLSQGHLRPTSTTKSCPCCFPPDADTESFASSHQSHPRERKKHVSRQRKLAERNAEESGLRQEGTLTPNLVRMPKLISGRQRHNLTPDVQAQFEKFLEEARKEIEHDTVDLEPWLRLATWWLLKSRKAWEVVSHTQGPPNSRNSTGYAQATWDCKITPEQASADLLKSSWILENVLLQHETSDTDIEEGIMKIIKDLMRAHEYDLSFHRNPDFPHRLCEDRVLLSHNLAFLETFQQPIESKKVNLKYPSDGALEGADSGAIRSAVDELLNYSFAVDDVSNAQRWFTVDAEHGGYVYEQVLYRTFVNAQVGAKNIRVKTQDAPYMLLLWTRSGESELYVSLCNQRNTLNLCKIFTIQDLEQYDEGGHDGMEVILSFPSQEAVIRFLTTEDGRRFSAYPRDYFMAIKERAAKDAELAIFQTVVDSYHDGRDLKGPKPKSCSLRLYETIEDEFYKTTRRLVVSSPAVDHKKPWCFSYWLPLSDVRLQIEDCVVTLIWSDFKHCERLSRSGNFDYYWSYEYQPDQPNRKVILQFASIDDVENFRDCILFLTECQNVDIRATLKGPKSTEEIRVYNIRDQNETDLYHAIVVTSRNPRIQDVSKVYFVYRDLDFICAREGEGPGSIKFPALHIPHYISTMADMSYEPNDTMPDPELKRATRSVVEARLSFGCVHQLAYCMELLTSWKLNFFLEIPKLILDPASRIRRKTVFRYAKVHLWERPLNGNSSKMQLAVRLEDPEETTWLTITRPASVDYQSQKNEVVLQKLRVQKGKYIDMKTMTASYAGQDERHFSTDLYNITIKFGDPQVKREFLDYWQHSTAYLSTVASGTS